MCIRSNAFLGMINLNLEMFTTLISNTVVLLICDLSVGSTTQALYISSSSSCAGVAAGELAKDQRHQDTVEEAGCDFIPLVVESFGVRSPFALKFINTIADCTTARSGSSIILSRRNLLQQLLVSLLTSTAKMILRYWALQGGDSDFPTQNNYFVFVIVIARV